VKTLAKNLEEKKSFSGETLKVIGPEYESGTPQKPHAWRKKIQGLEEMLKYLRSGERYWYNKEWYGSEKRKNPA